MKTQSLYKKLSLPLLLTVISATGIGITPARSASLTESQGIFIAQRKPRCTNGLRPPDCSWDSPDGRIGEPREERPTSGDNPSYTIIEPPTKPVIRYPVKPVCDPPRLVPPNCTAKERRHHPIDVEQQPAAEPAPNAEPLPQN